MGYTPPFDITENILDISNEIMESIGALNPLSDMERLPRLRRVSRIKSIHASLAIENNSLSFENVTDVINGKRVLGKEDEILAVKNAYEAYRTISTLDPYSLRDLLKTHEIMMRGLVSEAGQLRTGGVGVFGPQGQAVHIAPPASMVHENITKLFDWLRNSNTNPLIKSCVFHYEFEFIHPFSDGNGRMGRLWQTVILFKWKPIFEWVPIESIIKENQDEYYRQIMRSTAMGSSTPFIEFMLGCINSSVKDIIERSRLHIAHVSRQVGALMSVMDSYPMTATELMEKLGLQSRNGFRDNYLKPALEAGLIKMTCPDRPTSKNQRYYKV